MRIIPKKIKVKNTVWKCYSMPDVIAALVMFAIIFASITTGNWVLAVIFGIVSVVMFMPTQDGIFYVCVLENIKFLFSKKKYTSKAKSVKESVDALVPLKGINDNGLIEYTGGGYGRVIKIGQKNFGIEDGVQQNIDINYFANALKLLDGNQSADIVKIDRPVNLDRFAGELFERLTEIKGSGEPESVKTIKDGILRERIDAIDKRNNIRKQYISDYYIVLYGKNELDLENTAVNVSSEINKCGLNTQILSLRETAVFLKYSNSREFDEREIRGLADEELIEWIKPKEVTFKANKYTIDGNRSIGIGGGGLSFARKERMGRGVVQYTEHESSHAHQAGGEIQSDPQNRQMYIRYGNETDYVGKGERGEQCRNTQRNNGGAA